VTEEGWRNHWRRLRARQQRWWLLALAGVLVVAVAGVGVAGSGLLQPSPTADTLSGLAPFADLDSNWGSYLPEREWGTPREAVGSDGWGLSWRGAIDTSYSYGDDGIAAMTTTSSEFRLGWAFWDGAAEHVTERFMGVSDPQGVAGAAITDARVFNESTPNHSYQRLTYVYPPDDHWFSIELESARYNATRMTMVATATNTSSAPHSLDIVFKAWLAPGGTIEPLANGLLLVGQSDAVAVVGMRPTSWQISPDKAALDRNLRTGSLTGDGGGHIGALAYHLDLAGGSTTTIRIGVAELTGDGEPNGGASPSTRTADPGAAAAAARAMLDQSGQVARTRRSEADSLFGDQVTDHQQLYQQALMTLLWNESYYRWDGTTAINPEWAGRIDAHDVLIMPDKWKYPYLDAWHSAFAAVAAALIDPQLAEAQLRFILSGRWQQPDGHIPCNEWSLDLECPPIYAWAVWRVYEASRDATFLADVYPGLQANYDYWWQHNEVGDALFTGGSLGMDNLPRGDHQAQADASAWMAFFARDMVRIASEVRDPAGSARYWEDRGRIADSINAHLWDEATGFYYDQSGPGELILDKSYSGLIPFIAGVVPDARVPRILAALRDASLFMSPGGIRSLSADSPHYTPDIDPGVSANWRGPVWLPINYLLIDQLTAIGESGLANDLRTRVVTMVERDWQESGRLHEYFNGDTGTGLGGDEASWTALVANLISEGWPAPAPATQ
jgi:hypothetical protein